MYYCPKCGAALNFDSKVFVNCGGRVVGCEDCLDLELKDAEDALDYVEE